MPARVDELARKLIEQHGSRAVHIAVEGLNQSIDERDHPARDFWAQVVHAIYECQRLGHSPNARHPPFTQSFCLTPIRASLKRLLVFCQGWKEYLDKPPTTALGRHVSG